MNAGLGWEHTPLIALLGVMIVACVLGISEHWWPAGRALRPRNGWRSVVGALTALFVFFPALLIGLLFLYAFFGILPLILVIFTVPASMAGLAFVDLDRHSATAVTFGCLGVLVCGLGLMIAYMALTGLGFSFNK